MKRLKKISLSALAKDELGKRELSLLNGGDCLCRAVCNVTCRCTYVASVSSLTDAIQTHPVTLNSSQTSVDEISQRNATMTGLIDVNYN